jgi:hypothetical protein
MGETRIIEHKAMIYVEIEAKVHDRIRDEISRHCGGSCVVGRFGWRPQAHC